MAISGSVYMLLAYPRQLYISGGLLLCRLDRVAHFDVAT